LAVGFLKQRKSKEPIAKENPQAKRMFITDVVKHLLILNIIMFLASLVFGTDMLALYYPGSEKFAPYQLVTHFFMHANLMHIFFNMFALVMFGSSLERLWGPRRFLFYYFFCAFGAAALHLAVNFYEINQLESMISAFHQNPNFTLFNEFFEKVPFKRLNAEYHEAVMQMGELIDQGNTMVVTEAERAMYDYVEFKKNNEPVVGASGAIFGLLLAFGMYFPNQELMLIFLPIPIKAKFFIPLLMLLELYLGVNQFAWDNIAHFAHLGGALFGFLLILYWRSRRS
jgi:membrane associated rhomboid family serine protease